MKTHTTANLTSGAAWPLFTANNPSRSSIHKDRYSHINGEFSCNTELNDLGSLNNRLYFILERISSYEGHSYIKCFSIVPELHTGQTRELWASFDHLPASTRSMGPCSETGKHPPVCLGFYLFQICPCFKNSTRDLKICCPFRTSPM